MNKKMEEREIRVETIKGGLDQLPTDALERVRDYDGKFALQSSIFDEYGNG